MTIDEPTLTTVLGLASLTSSAIFFTLAMFARQIPGVALWSLGCLAVGFATVLDGPRLVTDWRVASLFFNIPFSVGQAFMLAGTLQFCGRSRSREALVVLSVLGIVLTVVFTYALPDTAWRIGTLSAYQTFINIWTAWILLKYPDRFSRTVFRVAAIVAMLQACSAFTQGTLIVLSSKSLSYAAPELPIANIVSWAGALLSTLVGNAVLFLLIMLRLVAELRRAADRDVLTGLLNRRGLRPHIDAILERQPAARPFAVLLLDIDEFKSVNDTFGHEFGDRVLQTMGQVLLDIESPQAKACRWGGEEFCVVVDGATLASVISLAEAIRTKFERETSSMAELDKGCTASAGIGLADPDTPLEVAKVFAAADAQLYRAKRAGRNRTAFESEKPEPPSTRSGSTVQS
jgi:diguanylate cyclase (GGDEF)-like protein